jgi:hypothetical protein
MADISVGNVDCARLRVAEFARPITGTPHLEKLNRNSFVKILSFGAVKTAPAWTSSRIGLGIGNGGEDDDSVVQSAS